MDSILLRASQSERWINCPPSVHLATQAERVTTIEFDDSFALEGTLAHELVALELERMLVPNYNMDDYNAKLAEIQSNTLYAREMLDHTEVYLDVIRDILNECQARQVHPKFFIEEQMQTKVNGIDVSGTSDFRIEAGDTLYVTDYKYGMGIEVSAVDNKQLLTYALLHMLTTGRSFKNFVLIIVQPRIENISKAEYGIETLIAHQHSVVEAIDLIVEHQGIPKVGKHCKYCSAKPQCPAHKEKLDDLEYLGLLPSILSASELIKVLQDAEYIIDWLKDVKAYAYNKAMDGYHWPGFKVVETRRRRVISDQEAAAATLISAGYKATDVFETKLLPITKLEKVMGKNEFTEVLRPFIKLSEQKYDLVEVSDKRPAATLMKPGDEF